MREVCLRENRDVPRLEIDELFKLLSFFVATSTGLFPLDETMNFRKGSNLVANKVVRPEPRYRLVDSAILIIIIYKYICRCSFLFFFFLLLFFVDILGT